MQQSKALCFVNFFFRISLDLFELATFGTNYGFHTAGEAITDARKWFCDIAVHSPDRHFVMSKIPEAQKSNGLRSGDFNGHRVAEMK